MLKVDLLYPGCITAPNGLSHFVGKMQGLKDLFAENDVELRVISADLYSPRQYTSANTKPKKKTKIALWIARHSAFITRFLFYIIYEKPAKTILEYYENQADKGEVLAFQDMMTCYYYLKKYNDKTKKVLLTIHSSGDMWSTWHYDFPKMKGWFFKSFKKDVEQTLFNGCDKIGFVADYPRQYFYKHYPYGESKTYFAYTSMEKGEKPSPMVLEEKVKIVTSGTLCARKNQMGVLNAIGLLPEEYQKQISFTILSNGDMKNALEKRAETLSAEVIFTGKVDCVEDYLKEANCFILYSKDEGQPMSIVEAMRMGLPIIGSNVAGIPEQINDGVTGFVAELDEVDLANKIRFIIDNKEKLPSMGVASYELYLQKFTLEAMVNKYSEIYKSSVGKA